MKLLILITLSLPLISVDHQTELKQNAFAILSTKCNVCHTKENPRMVFAEENMDQRARKIKWQVFTLKRMPKGNEIKLTENEKKILKEWIDSL